MSFFNNVILELYSFNDEEGYDDYGEKLGNYEYRETICADMQPLSAQDSLEEFGKILQDTFKVYISYNIEVNDTDIIKVKGKPETYTITGSPLEWNHLLNHKKLLIQKQRK